MAAQSTSLPAPQTLVENDDATGVRKTPFQHPNAQSKIQVSAPLSTEQTTKYHSVLNTISQWTLIPTTSAPKAPTSPITEDEQMWLTRECILRYLRATKWDPNAATTRLLNTLAWRREYGLYKDKTDHISPENETGKQLVIGYDNNARPCLYLLPAKQNTERSDRQIEHLVFMLERAIDLMPPGQENLALIINFADTSKGQGATLQQGKQTLSILQNHYPERLGRALVINIPWFFWAFMKLITPFIDPLTRQKLVFNESLRNHIPPSQLLVPHGGDLQFEYIHSVYWPALNGLATERRAQMKERWTKGGKRVGEFEAYLRGGQEMCLLDSMKRGDGGSMEEAAEKMDNLTVSEHKELKLRKTVSIYEDGVDNPADKALGATSGAATT